MKTFLKMASLAALTAATFALPAAAADLQGGQVKCQPAMGMAACGAKCAGKCATKNHAKARHGGSKHAKAKCGAKNCAPKCGAKCAPKS
jgi:hypothetical protein